MSNSADENDTPEKRTLGRDLRLLELIVDNIDDLIAVIDSQGKRVWNVIGGSALADTLVLQAQRWNAPK